MFVVMTSVRKLLLVALGVFALHGLQACASETELNPQPLPPQGGEPVRAPGSDNEKSGAPADSTGSSGSSGTGGTSGGAAPAPNANADGGTDGGASDGGGE